MIDMISTILYIGMIIVFAIILNKIYTATIEKKYPKRSTQIWIYRWGGFSLMAITLLTNSITFITYILAFALIVSMLIWHPRAMANLQAYEKAKEKAKENNLPTE